MEQPQEPNTCICKTYKIKTILSPVDSVFLVYFCFIYYIIHVFLYFTEGLRRRGGDGPQTDSDLDSILQHHQQLQEKLAEDMVSLARNMKDHAKAASNIVKDDNKVIQYVISLYSYRPEV